MKFKITVDGQAYEVEVEAVEAEPARLPTAAIAPAPAPASAPRPRAAPPGPAGGAAEAGGPQVCRSPIAGTVVRVLAQDGQAMQPGDGLVVLEAMKMETHVTAPAPATVGHVLVRPGEAVVRGQVLVEFA